MSALECYHYLTNALQNTESDSERSGMNDQVTAIVSTPSKAHKSLLSSAEMIFTIVLYSFTTESSISNAEDADAQLLCINHHDPPSTITFIKSNARFKQI